MLAESGHIANIDGSFYNNLEFVYIFYHISSYNHLIIIYFILNKKTNETQMCQK